MYAQKVDFWWYIFSKTWVNLPLGFGYSSIWFGFYSDLFKLISYQVSNMNKLLWTIVNEHRCAIDCSDTFIAKKFSNRRYNITLVETKSQMQPSRTWYLEKNLPYWSIIDGISWASLTSWLYQIISDDELKGPGHLSKQK